MEAVKKSAASAASLEGFSGRDPVERQRGFPNDGKIAKNLKKYPPVPLKGALRVQDFEGGHERAEPDDVWPCLLYTSPSPRD